MYVYTCVCMCVCVCVCVCVCDAGGSEELKCTYVFTQTFVCIYALKRTCACMHSNIRVCVYIKRVAIKELKELGGALAREYRGVWGGKLTWHKDVPHWMARSPHLHAHPHHPHTHQPVTLSLALFQTSLIKALLVTRSRHASVTAASLCRLPYTMPLSHARGMPLSPELNLGAPLAKTRSTNQRS
jgi:hypothetical protein